MADSEAVNEIDAASVATESLPRSIHTLWRVVAAIEAALLLGGSLALGVLVGRPSVSAGLACLVASFSAVRWWVNDLSYARWRWGIDDRWIERHRGVIVRTTQVVARSRVQTLTTRTGPIDRWLGLSSIVVHTAGTHAPNLTIPHLEADAAERLRSELGR